ncbi:MAG TPA: methyl-accepting chemotaxis protein [Sphingomicrobium sp.]|nr:methyl-accepting chemotaxis protein [Sphingomicrobium sp.]
MISQLIDRIRGKSGAAISTIAQAAIDLEAVTKTMTAEAEMTSATAASIVHAAEMASGNVRAVAGATERFLISVQEISRQIKESVATSRVAVEIARKTVDNATRLSEEARRIGDIVQLIAGIAEQTNLLALNATIESARAGDAGKGFAVVAQEVKTLAMQTAQAAKQVSGQIAGIQSSTGDALSAMAHITDAINDMSKSAAVVAEAAAQQQINVNEIAANINEASKRTDDVASNIAEVENAAGRTRTISDRVLILAQSVTEQTGHLDRDMSTFFETARFA